jgi:hypothetical protein
VGKRLFGGAFTAEKIAGSPKRARTIRLKVTFAVLQIEATFFFMWWSPKMRFP